MDYENARNAMLDALSAEFSKINISVTVDNVTIVLTASDFRITTNINELLSSAFKLGRSDSDPYQNYLKRIEIAENGLKSAATPFGWTRRALPQSYPKQLLSWINPLSSPI